jgi:hypothetical protein
MTRWVQLLTAGMATVILGAGVAGGLYVETGLLPLFSRFGQDQADNIGGYHLNAKGEPFFLFQLEDGTLGRWERVVPDRLGYTAGSVWIDGVPWRYASNGSVTGTTFQNYNGRLEVYPLPDKANVWVQPPLDLRVSAQDSLGHRSGDLWLRFRTCDRDSVEVVPNRPDPQISPRNWYRVVILRNENGQWETEQADLVDSDGYVIRVLDRGQYRLYFGMIDSLGMFGHFVGPVQFNSGSCD